MKPTIFKFFSALVFSLGVTPLFAQNSIASAGGKANGMGGSVNYTIGQMAFITNIGLDGTMSEGVQQTYEIMTLTDSGLNHTDVTFSVVPNPTTDFLQLKVSGESLSNFQYKLFDLSGRLLISKPITENLSSISMTSYLSGTYILKITEVEQVKSLDPVLKSFKIIKK
jgi:hypothetical protein